MLNGWNRMVRTTSAISSAWTTTLIVSPIPPSSARFFAWALLLAGGIACLARISGWPWPGIAIACAILHLVAAAALARFACSRIPRAFPITRAEFQKDREWIETLQLTKNAKD